MTVDEETRDLYDDEPFGFTTADKVVASASQSGVWIGVVEQLPVRVLPYKENDREHRAAGVWLRPSRARKLGQELIAAADNLDRVGYKPAPRN